MKFTLEEAMAFLDKIKPTRQIENNFEDTIDWMDNFNPIKDLKRININIHNDIADRWYEGHNDLIKDYNFVQFVIDGHVPETSGNNFDFDTGISIEEFFVPYVEQMNTSEIARKDGLKEFKAHLLYVAMENAFIRKVDDEMFDINDADILEPLKWISKIDNELQKYK